MAVGNTIALACSSFAITNIDDIFVLTTFFAEASTSRTLTALKIVLGQYLGFTAILIVSLVGMVVAVSLPPEPIGFLGWLPIMLGISRMVDVLSGRTRKEKDVPRCCESDGWAKGLLKVSAAMVMNGGDNVATYVPLFAQARVGEVAVIVVTFYVLLGVWCVATFLVMKQKHILAVAQRHARVLVPFLYIGLGVYIIIKSSCYPWSVQQIDSSTGSHRGHGIMLAVSMWLVLVLAIVMILFKSRQRQKAAHVATEAEDASDLTDGGRAQVGSGSIVANGDAGSLSVLPSDTK